MTKIHFLHKTMIAFKTPLTDNGKGIIDSFIKRMRDRGYSFEDKKYLPLLMNTEGANCLEEDKEIYNLYVAVYGDLLPVLNDIQAICRELGKTPKLYLDSSGAFEKLEYLLVEL